MPWQLKLSVIRSDRWFLAGFGPVWGTRWFPIAVFPPRQGICSYGEDRGGGRWGGYCEGLPPAGRACAPRKGSYSWVPLYILYRREELGHVPSRRRDALDWGRPISLNITNPPLKHGQLVAAEGKKWRKNCDGPNLIRSFLISNAT